MLFKKKKEALITVGIGHGVPLIPAETAPVQAVEAVPAAPGHIESLSMPAPAASVKQDDNIVAALVSAIPEGAPASPAVSADDEEVILPPPAVPVSLEVPAPPPAPVVEAVEPATGPSPEAPALAAPEALPEFGEFPAEAVAESAAASSPAAPEAGAAAAGQPAPQSEAEMFQTFTPESPEILAGLGSDAGVEPADQAGWGVDSDVPLEQCPYCLNSVPTNLDFCDKCGNRIHDAGPVSEEEAPASDEIFEPPLNGSVPLDLDTTRKLTVKPVPDLLQGTTLLVPARLILHAGSYKEERDQTHTLKLSATTFGRGSDNDFAFPEEEFISRHHCEICYHKYQNILKDLNSANGSYVNDVRVKETILRDGDSIQIGALRFTFEDPMEKLKKKKAQAELE